MAASYSAAAQAFMRLSTTADYHTKSDDEVDALTRELARVARSSEDAQSIVDHCLRVSRFCPTVADFEAAATAVHKANEPEYSMGASKCRCNGVGWINFDKIIAGRGRYAFAAPCTCHPLHNGNGATE